MTTLPDIRLKRAYDAPSADDGTRVLVDRLWPRGVKKEALALDEWDRDIAPSPGLRTWFGHDPARFAEFSRKYRAELAANEPAVTALLTLAKKGPLTLIYAAHDTQHNHAVVLADVLREQAGQR